MICATHYIQAAVQMVFNKEMCMLIYINQNNGAKINCYKNKLKYQKYEYEYKTLKKN